MENTESSLGEQRERTKFNPSDSSAVQQCKEKAAELINYIADEINPPDDLSNHQKGEFLRLKNLAMTATEEAAMWAVKAATLSK